MTVGPRLSRRLFLAAVSAGSVAAVAGCSSFTTADRDDDVTPAQIDQLAGQVTVQERLVTAYATAFAADPQLAVSAAALADQCGAQLTRLRAAAPGAAEPASSTSVTTGPADPVSTDPAAVRAALQAEVAAAASSHATACTGFSGARAALLGSLSAGLRGQEQQLA